MNTSRRIAKNTTYLLISSIVSHFLYILAVMYIARYLGAGEYGVLATGLAFTGLFAGISTDLGLGMLTVREVSRNKKLTNKYLGNTSAMKAVMAILTLIFTIIITFFMGYSQETIMVTYLITLAFISSSFAAIFFSLFQAKERMEYQAIIISLDNIFMIALIFIAMFLSLDVIAFAAIYMVRNTIVMVYMFLVYAIKFTLPPIEFDLEFWKSIFKESLPFAVIGIFLTLYFMITSIMLSVMAGNEAVGFYNSAYKLIFFFLSLYAVYMVAIFPVMSNFYKKSHEALKFAYKRSFKYTLLISLPLAAGITIMAPKIIISIYGAEYIPAVIPFQILAWTLIFLFINGVSGNLLGSANRQLTVTIITGIGAVIDIIANMILITYFSYVGASIATLITEFSVLPLFVYLLLKLGYADLNMLKDLPKIIVSTIIMSAVMLFFKDNNLILTALIGLAIYICAIHLTHTIDEEDKSILRKIIGADQEYKFISGLKYLVGLIKIKRYYK